MAKGKPAAGVGSETFLTESAGLEARRKKLDALTIEQRRDALRGRRGGIDVTKLSDEEVETLWTSLDEEQREAYLTPE